MRNPLKAIKTYGYTTGERLLLALIILLGAGCGLMLSLPTPPKPPDPYTVLKARMDQLEARIDALPVALRINIEKLPDHE